jgi:UDP-glucose:(heptosyl)LPS alpha-1,3-glucosyltransferase
MEALAAPGAAAGMREAARTSVTDLSLDVMAERLLRLYHRLN